MVPSIGQYWQVARGNGRENLLFYNLDVFCAIEQ